ncbi:hypothetical protein AVEN_183906-1 [Araneus ventricosus]|uniref:Uncharacterized protein n=1 Tax=Araneus ventricosus TaxID=182803 RepID=A0A4Y2V5S7_ARAVE|nr:hypothetical protein AVEN_183906-1 [Araneus ventricosus]
MLDEPEAVWDSLRAVDLFEDAPVSSCFMFEIFFNPSAFLAAESTLDESLAAESTLDESLAAESTLDESLAAESTLDESLAAESTLDESLAAESTLDESLAAESTLDESLAAESTLDESLAAESTLDESLAAESTLDESLADNVRSADFDQIKNVKFPTNSRIFYFLLNFNSSADNVLKTGRCPIIGHHT